VSTADPDTLAAPSVQHVALLGALFMIWGALTMVIGASTLALGIAAAALIASGRNGGSPLAANLTVVTFTTFAILALVWGAVHLFVGAVVRRYRPWSRNAALMLGTVDLLLLPYGTGLGFYSLWTLLRHDAKQLFES
jgi:hypothetical protein